MGYWIETCMISNLPIPEETECYITYVIEFARRSLCTGPTDKYQPILPPVLGKYDSYGRVYDYEPWADKLVFPDTSRTVNATTFREFQTLIRAGAHFKVDPDRYIFPVLIRKDIWDMAIHLTGSNPDNVDPRYYPGWHGHMNRQPPLDEIRVRKQELRVLIHFMERMRKSFHLPAGAGSQEEDFDLPWVFNKFVSTLAKENTEL